MIIYFVYFMATLFSLGCFFIPLGFVLYSYQENDLGWSIVFFFFVWPLSCFLAVLSWLAIADLERIYS